MKLAVFDFDGTLVPKDTLPLLLAQWKKNKYSRTKYYKAYFSLILLYIQYKTGISLKLSRDEMRLLAVKKFNCLFAGMSEEEVRKFFLACSKELSGLFNQKIVAEIKEVQVAGYHTVLLSGAYQLLLEHVGKMLDFDTVIGTQLHFVNNKFDSLKEIEVINGNIKNKKIHEYFHEHEVDWLSSRAYADSLTDLELLEAVGLPIAVNPEVQLKKIAEERNWKIIS